MNIIPFLKSKLFLKQVIISMVILLILIFVLAKWMQVTTNHDQKIEVPDLSKKTVSNAKIILQERDLILHVIDSANFNPSYPPYSIIEQNPQFGDFVKEKRKIYVTLNPSGFRKIPLPKVVGKTKRNATVSLKSIGFKIGSSHQYVKDIGKDVVRGMFHKGKAVRSGTLLPKNSVIEFKLGDGNGN